MQTAVLSPPGPVVLALVVGAGLDLCRSAIQWIGDNPVTVERIDTLIIGVGQAGLAMSHMQPLKLLSDPGRKPCTNQH